MSNQNCMKYLGPAAICVLAILGILYYYFFSAFSAKSATQYVYIDTDDNIDSVYFKLSPIAKAGPYSAFKTLVRHSKYADHIKTGRYEVSTHIGAFKLFRHLKNGQQSPVSLTIPSVRTVDNLSEELSKHLMLSKDDISRALKDEATCRKYDYDTTTIMCMFIPNTYDIYWNCSIDKLLSRMQKESRLFWTDARRSKAEAPLQADPTIKFAWKRFELKRIYNNLLHIHSPYNTYMNPGLPPGPIRIPSVAGIDAVLNLVHHDYLYMCAKEDFSGTHNFARTYDEHLKNAARYSAALNSRGIK